ncbi:uncharacterized protein LOC110977418 [Acanthaster planci]|uniref:Uncharacterized protein LOC110977418 n=1 Tax=Acanthaster planci TaxID=133434 RepID=A0A8B7Y4G7_ACAPL|nr:uncharacterized protein LOC110977418 [Acanthaster planci]
METMESYSSAAAADMTSLDLPQQGTQPVVENQGDFDPDRADFLEPSIPTESACGEVSFNFTVPSQGFQPSTKQIRSTSSSLTREILNQRTQQLIDDINAKRKRDTSLLADFKKAIEVQASNSYDNLEQAMFQMYEGNGKVIQEKLQELFATLDRISKLEMELEQFKTSLGALYSEIQGPAARPT